MSRTALLAAASLALAADLAAQQAPAPRFALAARPAGASVTPAMAIDSAARYAGAARTQRMTGAALGVLGGAGLGAAYAGWAGSGRMGMSGGQAAAMTVGAAAVALGWERWRRGHESELRARRWADRAAVATLP